MFKAPVLSGQFALFPEKCVNAAASQSPKTVEILQFCSEKKFPMGLQIGKVLLWTVGRLAYGREFAEDDKILLPKFDWKIVFENIGHI